MVDRHITNRDSGWRDKAKQGGFAQVRASLESFEGTVADAVWGKWPGDKEFIDIACTGNVVLKAKEDLEMDITETFSFRVNYSESSSSFFIADFLEAADKLKLIIPEDLVGKRIRWAKVLREAKNPQYNTENFIPVAILESTTSSTPAPQEAPSEDALLSELLDLAVGKTERQFRSAVGLSPKFANSPILTMVKMGAVTDSFLKGGKLVLDGETYKKA